MSLTRLDLRGHRGPFADVLPRPADAGADVREGVAAILARVRAEGDAALRELTARFDGATVDDLRVPDAEIGAALARVPDALREALEVAWRRIHGYHAHEGGAAEGNDFVDGGVRVRHLVRPVGRAGCYAPGGRARYPSTVLMCAAPARVAGVAELVLCVPPAADGRIDDATLAAAAVAGVDEVYRVGGAQAIGAMAYGTASIAPVDVVVGPGNRYVAEAKRQVSGTVGVASAFAGPSEVVVVAGPTTPAALAAVDLVVQAEHGPDGLAWLVTWSPEKADEVDAEVAALVAASPRRADLEATLAGGGYACLVDGPEAALAVANVVAPEHLELMVEGAEELLPLVTAAGAVFCGPWSPASLGDYLAGPNHVLPTNRTARFASALRADDFRRHIHAVTATREAVDELGPHVVALAETEGLPAHALSLTMRMGARVSPRVPLRSDLAVLAGYHSPQVPASVRLNTNESPFPPPESWRAELENSLEHVEFNRYPDREATALRQAVAADYGVGPAEVFCANGSDEVLQCLLLAFGGPGRRVLVFEPTYKLHSHIARITGTEVVVAGRGPDFTIDADEAARVLAEVRPEIVFLCSPNNPTGRSEPAELVRRVVEAAPGLVVVDEAYGQFAPASALHLRDDPGLDTTGLAVVRTFSKTWAMAASRLGYLVAEAEVVAGCEVVALPYHLSAPTQLAGLTALKYRAEMEARVAAVAEERGRLAATLAELPVDIWPSDANFILFRPQGREAKEVWQALLDRGVLIRDCSGWDHLEGCLRVTVGTPKENDRFLGALKESL